MVDLGESISKGFSSWWSAIGVMLLLAAIYGLVAGGFSVASYTVMPDIEQSLSSLEFSDSASPDFAEVMAMVGQIFTPQVMAVIATSIVVQSILSMLLMGIILIYLRKKDLSIATNGGLQKLFALIGLSIISTVLIVAGFILFIIPGIIISIYLAFAAYALILRGKGPIEAIKYSMKLVKENWWRTLGTFFIFGIISYAVAIVLAMVLGIPSGLLSTFVPGFASEFVSGFVGGFNTILQTSLIYAMGLVYFLGLEKEKGLDAPKGE